MDVVVPAFLSDYKTAFKHKVVHFIPSALSVVKERVPSFTALVFKPSTDTKGLKYEIDPLFFDRCQKFRGDLDMFVIDTSHFVWNRGTTYQMHPPAIEKENIWFRSSSSPVCDEWVPADGVCNDVINNVHTFGGFYERASSEPCDVYCKHVGTLRFSAVSYPRKNKKLSSLF